MPERTAQAHWEGPVKEGHGWIGVESGVLEAGYSFDSRFENGKGTNPEELLGAAHAGCFTMALALALTEAGHPPIRIATTARVAIEKTADGFRIPHIDLQTEGEVVGIDAVGLRATRKWSEVPLPGITRSDWDRDPTYGQAGRLAVQTRLSQIVIGRSRDVRDRSVDSFSIAAFNHFRCQTAAREAGATKVPTVSGRQVV